MSFITFQFRRNTAANWTTDNPTLGSAEFGVETDTLAVKLGDGATAWNSLGYYSSKIRVGTTVPATGLGVVGDVYIRSNGDVSLKTAVATWTFQFSIIGPQGTAGTAGSTGAPGAAGVIQDVTSPNASIAVAGTTHTTVDIASQVQQTFVGRAVGAGTGTPGLLTATQATAMLNPATALLPGNLTAAHYAFINLFSTTVNILATANSTSSITADGATNDTTAFQALLTNAPDGATIVLPGNNAVILINAALSIPSGKHFNIVGGGPNKTTIVQCSQTADHFTVADWFSTFTNVGFASANVTTTAAQALTSGTVLTTSALTAGQLALVATSGTITVGSTNTGTNGGWQTLTYSARTSTTVTLSQTGTGNSVIGTPLVFKTAGAAVNAGNLVGIDVSNCAFTCVFNGYVCSGSTANQSNILYNGFLNTINFDILIDGANWNGIVDKNTCDCTVNSRSVSHLEITQCGSLTGDGNQFIRGQYNARFGSTTSAYPAGVFGVYMSNTFFDNAGTDSVKVQGISAVQRLKFSSCWFSSAQAGKGLNLASTASTLPSDISLVNCNIYANSTDGVGGNGAQDVTIRDSQVSGNTTNGINSFVSSLYITNNRIGPCGGIGANGTGITLPSGAYATVMVAGNDMKGNTTAPFVNSSTSITDLLTRDNAGLMCPGTAVILKTFPALAATDTILLSMPIPVSSLQVGSTFRAILFGVQAAASNPITFTLRLGTAGTTGDATLLALAPVTASANGGLRVEFEFTVLTLGAAGTSKVSAINQIAVIASTTTNQTSATAAPAVNTTANNILTISGKTTSSTFTLQAGSIECIA